MTAKPVFLTPRTLAALLLSWISFRSICGFLRLDSTTVYIGGMPAEVARSIQPYPLLMAVGSLGALASLLPKAPAWLCNVFIGLLLVVHCLFNTQQAANWAQDAEGLRDDAAEYTSQKFLHGENPWNPTEKFTVAITTGPASVLLCAPFVAIFGEINWAAFGFWMAFFAVVFIGDRATARGAFAVLASLFLIDAFDFSHTMFWSQEELCFAYLLVAAAVWADFKNKPILCGLLFGFALCSRLNYLFPIAGFLLWRAFREPRNAATGLKLAGGIAIGFLLPLAPFALRNGREFWDYNPFRHAFDYSGGGGWPDTNPIFTALNAAVANWNETAVRGLKLVLAALAILVPGYALRRNAHPFWHIAIGAGVAHTLVWFPSSPRAAMDYSIFYVIPAFWAVAFQRWTSDSANASGATPDAPTCTSAPPPGSSGS